MRKEIQEAVDKQEIDTLEKLLQNPAATAEVINDINIVSLVVDYPEVAAMFINRGADVNQILMFADGDKLINQEFSKTSKNKILEKASVLLTQYKCESQELINFAEKYNDIQIESPDKEMLVEALAKVIIGYAKEKEISDNNIFFKIFPQLAQPINCIEIVNGAIQETLKGYQNSLKREPIIGYAIRKGIPALIESILEKDTLDVNAQIEERQSDVNIMTSLIAYAIEHKLFELAESIIANPKLTLDPAGKTIFSKEDEIVQSTTLGKLIVDSENISLLHSLISHPNFSIGCLNMDDVDMSTIYKLPEKDIVLLLGHGMTFVKGDKNDPFAKPSVSLLSYSIRQGSEGLISDVLKLPNINFNAVLVDENPISALIERYKGIKGFFKIVKEYNLSTKILFACARNNSWFAALKVFIENTDHENPFSINILDEQGNSLASCFLFAPAKLKWLLDKYTDNLLKQADKHEGFLFNINYKNTQGERLIDIAQEMLYGYDSEIEKDILNTLRKFGSVEPTSPLSVRLDLSNGRLDAYKPNLVNAPKIINLLYQKFPLTEEQIDEEINSFKSKDFTGYSNTRWSSGNSLTVPQVIELLSEMRDINDRLPMHWDFKKILASVMKVVSNSNDEETVSLLTYCLSDLYLCNLGKLINLLNVAQDQILDQQHEVSYIDKNLSDFVGTLEPILIAAKEKFKNDEKSAEAITRWMYDCRSLGSYNQAENWHHYSQVIHGIFNSSFLLRFDVNEKTDSYHFTSGLQGRLIPSLIEAINNKPNQEEWDGINAWRTEIHAGLKAIASQFIEEATNSEDESLQKLFDDLFYNPQYVFGEFIPLVSIEMLQNINNLQFFKMFGSILLDASDTIRQFVKQELAKLTQLEDNTNQQETVYQLYGVTNELKDFIQQIVEQYEAQEQHQSVNLVGTDESVIPNMI